MSTQNRENGFAFITREHPDYVRNRATRAQYADLYAGGQQFQNNASNYLVRRHKEPNDIYFERLNRVFYENYAGSIIDWYTAALFRREPVIQFEGADERARDFFNTFIDDCDRRGTSLAEFYRRLITQALIQGRAFVAIDFPRIATTPLNRAHEDSLGASRAYLTAYDVHDVINWSHDETGALEWVVIRVSETKQVSIQDSHWSKKTRWIYYDRTQFQLYTADSVDGQYGTPVLQDSGSHALSGQGTLPVFELNVREGLWLMNKAAFLQLEHFNKSNALAWALTMGLFASPVVYSDREFAQIVGESYFIQLGPQDRFGWTEPQGTVYKIASDNLDRLRNEIYRVCYLMNQAVDSGSAVQQSGLSKSWDFSVTQEILRAYGDLAKDSMRTILASIALARRDSIRIDISGLDEFDIQDFASEIAEAQSLLSMNIPSETLKRQVFKRISLKYLCDARQEIKTEIANEIDSGLSNN